MNVALVRPPLTVGPAAHSLFIVPPLGLAYLHAVANRFATRVQMIDSWANAPVLRPAGLPGRELNIFGQTADEIAAAVLPDTDVLLVSVPFSVDWPYVRGLFARLRARFPAALIVAGGEHVTALPELCMEQAPGIDLCGLGEGEHTVAEILALRTGGRPLTGIAGTCERLPDGTVRRNERRPRIRDVGALSWPDWEGVPLHAYFDQGYGYGLDLGPSLPILATRGCPYRCAFCSSPQMWTTAWRAREPADVVAEIHHLNATYGATNFDFYDLTAILRKEWIKEFCQLILASGKTYTFQLPAGTRSEAIDREVAALLFRAGCHHITYAPESGSPRMLRIINKRMKLDRLFESMQACIDEGVSVKLNVICGFPGETRADLNDTLTFLLRAAWLGADDMSVVQFTPYPGSALFDQLMAEHRIRLDDDYFAALAGYNSMKTATSYSDHLGAAETTRFKWLSIAGFYGTVYARRPQKFARLVRNVATGRETTRIEKALRTVLDRTWKTRRGLNRTAP